MSDRVLVQVAGGVLTATLNRPDKRNAIDAAMIDALLAVLERADLDAAVRAVAITGAGRDFCAGMDLNELLASADHTPEQNRQAALHFAEIFVRMRRLPKPVVALVRGRALAGGCGLATACDLILAAESAQFGYPEVQRGFVPAIVMTMLRRTVGEKIAFDLAATGRVLDGNEAAAVGLVSRVYEDADFEEQAGRGPAGTRRVERFGARLHQAAILSTRWPRLRRGTAARRRRQRRQPQHSRLSGGADGIPEEMRSRCGI